MPINKGKSNGAVTAPPAATTAPAPVSKKLQSGNGAGKKKVLQTPPADTGYKGRDFEAEARGKVACVAFNAALASPGIAGLSFTSIEEYLKLVEQAADRAVEYTWKHQKPQE